MFWTYYLTWFIGFVMGGVVVQILYKIIDNINKKNKEEKQ